MRNLWSLLLTVKYILCETRIDLYKTLVVGIKKALQSVMSFDCAYIAISTVDLVILKPTQGLAFCSQPFCEGDV